MPKAKVAIFSLSEDLHAHIVTDTLRRAGHSCHLVFTDQLATSHRLSWFGPQCEARIQDVNGKPFNVSDLTSIWWRRVNAPLKNLPDFDDDAAKKLVPNECRAALLGTLMSSFSGRWVNDPSAEVRADNKLVQLKVAKAAGFTVPDTLVSSEPDAIRRFVEEQGGHAIVKVVRGLSDFSVPARMVTSSELTDDASLSACPSIWQTAIEGEEHLRIHVFGKRMLAVHIRSNHLDWRPDLSVPMSEYALTERLETLCRRLLQELGLVMGVIDIKLTPQGAPVFLEINPQGQFAFMEALTKAPLGEMMAECLTETALAHGNRTIRQTPRAAYAL